MHSIKREINTRKVEIENIIHFLQYIQDNSESIFIGNEVFDKLMVQTSIKASTTLMLCNLVESTMTKCLNRIHEILKDENIKYDKLNKCIKKMLLVYYRYALNKNNNIVDSTEYMMSMIDVIRQNDTFSVSYDDMEKFYPLYSGNLDSRKITSILNKYGIVFDKTETELRNIKDYRNKLAHGESSFEEIGRQLTIQQIEVMCTKTVTYLEEMVNVLQEYIDGKKYRIDGSNAI